MVLDYHTKGRIIKGMITLILVHTWFNTSQANFASNIDFKYVLLIHFNIKLIR